MRMDTFPPLPCAQVDAPNECGVSFDDFQTMQPEDRVEAYSPNVAADAEANAE